MKKGMEIDIYTDRRHEIINAKAQKRRPDLERKFKELTGIDEEIWEFELVHEIVLAVRYNPNEMFVIDPVLTEEETG